MRYKSLCLIVTDPSLSPCGRGCPARTGEGYFQKILYYILFLALFPQFARAEGLVTMLSTNSVEITSNYTGTEIAIFGAVERDAQTVPRKMPYEIVVVVKGPAAPFIVRQKENMGGIWVNASQQKFGAIPKFYALTSSGKLNTIISSAQQKSLNLGLSALVSNAANLGNKSAQTSDESFYNALIRLRKEQNLFQQYEDSVIMQRANTFRANVPLPAHAPLGRYEVGVYLFSGGVLLASENSGFYVRKIGFEADTALLAKTKPFTYGVAAALMAVFIGWMASVVFRRD
jgi:uncharacterized protein (TIGR02186 family)